MNYKLNHTVMITIKRGNKLFEIVGYWSNGLPVLRLISESCNDYDKAVANYYHEDTYTCPSTGIVHYMDGSIR